EHFIRHALCLPWLRETFGRMLSILRAADDPADVASWGGWVAESSLVGFGWWDWTTDPPGLGDRLVGLQGDVAPALSRGCAEALHDTRGAVRYALKDLSPLRADLPEFAERPQIDRVAADVFWRSFSHIQREMLNWTTQAALVDVPLPATRPGPSWFGGLLDVM